MNTCHQQQLTQSIGLTSAECLNLINLKPTCKVEMYLVGSNVFMCSVCSVLKSFAQIIDAYEERLAVEEVEDLLRVIAELA